MPKTHYCVITIPSALADRTWAYLRANRATAFQSEDEPVTLAAGFDDGRKAEIQCIGSQSEASWTQMVLFDPNAGEIACTEPSDEFEGAWKLSYGEDDYVVHVIDDGRRDRTAVVTDGKRFALAAFTDAHVTAENVLDRLADAAMDCVEEIPAYLPAVRDEPIKFTFADLLDKCDGDTLRRHGVDVTEITLACDPVLACFRRVDVDPDKSLLVDDDFV